MNKQRERYEKETEGMTLKEKLEWVRKKLFYIKVDNYIEDWDEYRNYKEIERELEELIENEKKHNN